MEGGSPATSQKPKPLTKSPSNKHGGYPVCFAMGLQSFGLCSLQRNPKAKLHHCYYRWNCLNSHQSRYGPPRLLLLLVRLGLGTCDLGEWPAQVPVNVCRVYVVARELPTMVEDSSHLFGAIPRVDVWGSLIHAFH